LGSKSVEPTVHRSEKAKFKYKSKGNLSMFGIVKNYGTKGYGFCEPDDHQLADLFLHHSQLVGIRRLKEGDIIEFEIGERDGRPLALNIRLVTPSKTPLAVANVG
jgi:cold shock CspA family protein